MAERTFRKLGLADLQMLADAKRYAEALELWEIDEESARFFLSNPMNHFFACVEDDKIIGYVCGYELNRLDNAGNMLYIHGVGVHKDCRRQGIGRQMIAAVKQWCKISGISKLFLFSHKSNTAACALYQSMGGVADRDDDVSFFFNRFD